MQNKVGGMQKRILEHKKELESHNIDVKLYNKWEDMLYDYDVLHIMKISSDSYSTLKMAKKLGVKVIISPTINFEKNNKNILKLRFLKFFNIEFGQYLLYKSFQICDHILVETPQERDYIHNIYQVSLDKISVIPTGVSELKTNYSIETQTIKEDNFILHVGRFDRNKNQLNIIKALKGTGVKVIFIGGASNEEPEYFELCKKNADDNFIFLGWISNDDSILEEAYRKAKVVLLPSYKETFGISLVEGGIYGANLVCSEKMPILELGMQNYCNTCNPNDIKNMREVILQSYYSEKNPNNIKNIKNLFSLEKATKKHIDIYKQITGE